MYELRVKLPYLSKENPKVERMKHELVDHVARHGTIPSYAQAVGDRRLVELVEVPDDPAYKYENSFAEPKEPPRP
jgi:hypothetical protein